MSEQEIMNKINACERNIVNSHYQLCNYALNSGKEILNRAQTECNRHNSSDSGSSKTMIIWAIGIVISFVAFILNAIIGILVAVIAVIFCIYATKTNIDDAKQDADDETKSKLNPVKYAYEDLESSIKKSLSI